MKGRDSSTDRLALLNISLYSSKIVIKLETNNIPALLYMLVEDTKMATLAVFVLVYLLCVNFVTARAFRQDKAAAVLQTNRISEMQLLFMCLMGGSLGSIVASKVYRHKTHKQPFRFFMFSIFGLQILAVVAIVALALTVGKAQG